MTATGDPIATSLASAPWPHFKRMLASTRLPAALLDLDAVDHNLATLLAATPADGPRLRLAGKSLRCPAILRYLVDKGGGRVAGVMTFAAGEMALLADQGLDDFLAGYPLARAVDAAPLAHLASAGRVVTAMVDDPQHLDILATAAEERGAVLPVCLDVDASLRGPAGLHIGVRRSPLRDVDAVLALAARIAEMPSLRLRGIMAYEAQVAGLADDAPGPWWTLPVRVITRWIRRLIKRRSVRLAAARRGAVLHALREAGHEVDLVNGGGTGSVRSTSVDPSVTEVTIGSGLYCPALFDHYDDLDLRPALFFALPVVRRSDADHVTCMGGGYLASGPPAADRQPVVHAPTSLSALPWEGWGEVQTPMKVAAGATPPEIGDPIIVRPAKSGEPLERFAELLVVRGGVIVDRVPTYRGLGAAFT